MTNFPREWAVASGFGAGGTPTITFAGVPGLVRIPTHIQADYYNNTANPVQVPNLQIFRDATLMWGEQILLFPGDHQTIVWDSDGIFASVVGGALTVTETALSPVPAGCIVTLRMSGLSI